MSTEGQRLGAGLWTTVRLLPGVSRGLTAAVALAAVLAGLLPVTFTVATGLVVGAVPEAVRDGLGSAAGRRLLVLVVVAGGLYVLHQAVGQLVQAAAEVLGRRLNGVLRERAMAAALRPVGIGHLEDPALLDTIGLARNLAPGQFQPGGAVVGMVLGVGPRVQALASAAVVAAWSWPVAVGLVVAWAAALVLVMRFFFRMVALWIGRRGELRRAVYYRDLSLTPPAAKDLRVFGLRRWLGGRFTDAWLGGMEAVWRDRRQGRAPLVAALALHGVAMFAGVALVARAGVAGDLDLGAVAVLLGAVRGSLQMSIGDHDVMASYGAMAVPALLSLEEAVQTDGGAPAQQSAAGLPRRVLRFEAVSFGYPGASEAVFDGLDLEIRAGQSLAIVGVNGAGKTTLVKLLARLYEPGAGAVTVDGTALTDLDPVSWRRQLAVLFQDYLHYELPASDNVGFGAHERSGDARALERAARRAGALEFVEGLPSGWATVLSTGVEGGAELSGGQWQRIALARSLLAVEAGARVLVLDEPTANLDVRAEAELYDRFLDLTSGLTTILISHRFSTVRRADRIVVLEHGRVVEDGSHGELLAVGGRYAEMFRLQAARFTGDGDGAGGARAEGRRAGA